MKPVMQVLFAVTLLCLVSCGTDTATKKKSGAGPDVDPGPVDVTLIMDTSEGAIKVGLWKKKAPITVKNFLTYVDEGFYDNTIFHRVIPGFMIQCGGFTLKNKEKKTYAPIKNEADNGLPNKRGTLSMAKTDDPDSATSQFFINLKHNSHLDGQHAVFGKVLEGMDVVDKIAKVKTGPDKFMVIPGKGGGKSKYVEAEFDDVPIEPVIVNTIKRAEDKKDSEKASDKDS